MVYRFLSSILIVTLVVAALGQKASAVDLKYEFRSVWLTTAASLDWPGKYADDEMPEDLKIQDWPTSEDATVEDQKESLLEIIEESAEIGLNAIVFQVVPRGDAFYESERLPWSAQITGTAGEDPGWDPLEFAIEESHKRGMELHAWYNVYRIGDDGQDTPDESPQHVADDEPDWIEQDGNDLWLNPGIPDVTEWITGNVMEIVENYDVDAIHFDFARYNTSGYDRDSDLKDQYDDFGLDNLDDWRRENITRLMQDIYDEVQDVKPWVKLGTTPVGNYRSDEVSWGNALWAYSSVFQESRRWLEEGIQDYLAPQIYFDMSGSPEYTELVDAWVAEKFDRHIYVGIGAYRPSGTGDSENVRPEIPDQIEYARRNGGDGQMYFRYDNIKPDQDGNTPMEDRYDRLAIPPPMDWRDQQQPNTPSDYLLSHNEMRDNVNLEWDAVDFETEDGDDHVKYAVYRVQSNISPDPERIIDNRRNLLGLTGQTEFTDEREDIDEDDGDAYYVVTAISRNNIESDPSPAASIDNPTASEEDQQVPETFTLNQNYPNPFNPVTEITYELATDAHVELSVYDATGRRVATLNEGSESSGEHTVSFDGSSLSSGVYHYRLDVRESANGSRIHSETRQMTLIK